MLGHGLKEMNILYRPLKSKFVRWMAEFARTKYLHMKINGKPSSRWTGKIKPLKLHESSYKNAKFQDTQLILFFSFLVAPTLGACSRFWSIGLSFLSFLIRDSRLDSLDG
jgi:hypothetical protein